MQPCSFTTSATSRRGDLPDRNINDIHCPMFGGPDYKHNYLASSCRERQLSKTCTVKSCARRVNLVRPELVQVSAATERQSLTTEEIPVSKKPVRACAECGEVKQIHGRGLCGSCLHRLRKDGTIDDKYPSKRPGRKAANVEETKGSDLVDDAAAAVVDSASDPADDVINAGHTSPANEGTSPDRDVTAGETATNSFEALAKDYLGVSYEKVVPDTGLFRIPFDACLGEEAAIDISLTFRERDNDLFESLLEWAEKERRSLSDQILFALDNLVAEKVQRGEL